MELSAFLILTLIGGALQAGQEGQGRDRGREGWLESGKRTRSCMIGQSQGLIKQGGF